MSRYPETSRERRCPTQRMLRGQLRERYRNELKTATSISTSDGAQDEAVRAGVSARDGEDTSEGL